MRVGLVVNPTAGRQRAERYHAAVLRELRAHGHHVMDLSGRSAAAALGAARAAMSSLDALVVVGGDGMVQLGVNAVAGTDVPLGVVPLGSGNDIALGLGLPQQPGRAVDLILRELAGAGGRPTDAIWVADAKGGRWAMATFSAGLDAAVNARANRMARPRGPLRYPLALAATLPRFAATRYRVVAEDWEWEGNTLLVAAANVGRFGGGMHIAPSASPEDGLLDVVTVEDVGKTELMWVFPRIYAGTHVHHPKVDIRRARRVRIESLARREGYADGERVAVLPATVEAVRGAVRMLRPASPPAREGATAREVTAREGETG